MVERLYVPPARMAPSIELGSEEAHHLLRVKRCRKGDPVEVFTGDGFQYRSTVAEVSSRGLRITVEDRSPSRRECPLSVRVASAVPRGKRMDMMVEKLSELGVSELIPLDAARSVARGDLASASRREHWQRIAVEAARQCGRATLMEVSGSRRPPDLWNLDRSSLRLVAALAGAVEPLWSVLADEEVRDVSVVVGPEGDFETQELDGLLAAGFRPVHLGPTVLRVETAAVAAASAVVLWASFHHRDEDGKQADAVQ